MDAVKAAQSFAGPKTPVPKGQSIARYRGEVCALGRLTRAFDQLGISGAAKGIAQEHYVKACRTLKRAHTRQDVKP